jgi:hypothetical protein
MSECCCGSSKSEPEKVAVMATPQATDAAVEQPAVKPGKSECCDDKTGKDEKRGCCCS